MIPRSAGLVAVGLATVLTLDVVRLATAGPGREPVRQAASAPAPAPAPVETPSPVPTQPAPTVKPPPPKPLGPLRVLFGVRTTSGGEPTAPDRVLTALPNGRDQRPRPAALRYPLHQVSTANDLVVTTEVIEHDGSTHSGCGVAGCSTSYSSTTEQGIALHRISTGRSEVVTRGGFDGAPTWSPDGRTIAYLRHTRRPDGTEQDVVALLDSSGRDLGTLSDLPPNATDGAPVWAPNGTGVVTPRLLLENGQRRVRLMLLRLDGRPARAIADIELTQLAWSPDGRSLVGVRQRKETRTDGALPFSSGSDLWQVDVASGRARQLTFIAPDPNRAPPTIVFCGIIGGYGLRVEAPVWSPDSSRIAFLSNHRHAGQFARQFDVHVVDVASRRLSTAYAAPLQTCPPGTVSADLPHTLVELYGWVR